MVRDDIKKVMIIGSGPIVIGQACEFDYSGTQACKALRECGYKIVLVNSNPATIMTDPVMADATYIEPLNVARLEQIIVQEKPDALLPNLGGQTGLNLALELDKAGILEKYGVRVIGVNLEAIERGEDREIFKETMRSLNIDTPRSEITHSVEGAEQIAAQLGYPVVVRPAYTLGGTGGGLVYNVEELRTITGRGLEASLTNQCLIEESVAGWEELEVEVVRDSKGQMIAICMIENIDPIGVHTGDSFCSAPMLTIDEETQARLKEQAFRIVESIGVIGGTNVQFAHDPKSGRICIIEINPRTSRSSALASKATGFPIALISAKLAAGMTLDEIPYWRDGSLDKYTPSGDYIVLKFARWAFEKFRGVEDKLGTQMKAVGEVMSIGKTYKETFQKAIRALENSRHGLGFAKDFNSKSLDELLDMLRYASSERQFIMYEAIRKGATNEQLFALTAIKDWFIQQMRELVELEEKLLTFKGTLPSDELLIKAKKDGFSDRYLSKILAVSEQSIRTRREELGVVETWHKVPVSGVNDTDYYYSSYNGEKDEVPVTDNPKKVMILGGGPNRIGQGIEFDYCCVHAAFALRALGYETIMVNCNPETVSTDYDTSDKLYFEPVTMEDVIQIYRKEKPLGVIVQFGGQTPLNIARQLSDAGVKILGTSIDAIDIAEDRDLFRHRMDKLGIPMPESDMAANLDEAIKAANQIGYPLMIRPSFVLGGRGMEVIYDEEMLREYVAKAVGVTPDRPLLLDRFLQDALECESDALSDGENVFIPSIMEHIELAGIHSGDSISVYPTFSVSDKVKGTILQYAKKLGLGIGIKGLYNIQFIVDEHDDVYIIEVNPRSSRTVPFLSKATGYSLADIATEVIMGKSLKEQGIFGIYPDEKKRWYVKVPVFSFSKIRGLDAYLSPEMKSTGEAIGYDDKLYRAVYKALQAAGTKLQNYGTVFATIADKDKEEALPLIRRFYKLGFNIEATEGTAAFLKAHGIRTHVHKKISEGSTEIIDAIRQGHIAYVINTRDIGSNGPMSDGHEIRRYATENNITLFTALDTVSVLLDVLEETTLCISTIDA